MCIFRSEEPGGLQNNEMRSVLRSMSDKTRNKIIYWLNGVGQGNDDGWEQLVIPFIENVWPRERRFRTGSVRRQSFWFQRQRNLSEYLAHLVGFIMRRSLSVLQAPGFECFAFDPFSFV